MTYKPKRPLSKVRMHRIRPFHGYHPKRTEGFIGRGIGSPFSHEFSRNENIEEEFAVSLRSTGSEYHL